MKKKSLMLLSALVFQISMAVPAVKADDFIDRGTYVAALGSWDQDSDGAISPDELFAQRKSVFESFDSNKDDSWDIDEYSLYFAGITIHRQRLNDDKKKSTYPLFKTMTLSFLDLDRNGEVSHSEFIEGGSYWFAELDKNLDGSITMDDFTE